MSLQKQLIKELNLARECERVGQELKSAYDQLHRGKYATRVKQREKFESLLEPLNKLAARETFSPPIKQKIEPLAASTPFQPKNIPDLDITEKTYTPPYQDDESSISEINDINTTTDSIIDTDMDSEGEDEKTIKSTLGPTALNYVKNLGTRFEQAPKFDTTFGIRYEDSIPYVGNSPLVVEDDKITLPDGSSYNATPGLWELLILNVPTNYTAEDEAAYGDILQRTYAYKHHNDPLTPFVKSNAGYKYMNIVREILNSRGLVNPKKDLPAPSFVTRSQIKSLQGSGLNKIFTGAPVEYVYWDSIDELLERLYILYGELKAGNTNPSIINEIVNIIQEFKELH